MTKIPPKQAVNCLNAAFQTWGRPKRIKLDNGWPFIHPCHRDTPTLSILWWIGLGIEVVQNDPASPQQNGTVEGLQNICYRWVNPSKYDCVEGLQRGLDEVGVFQRGIYQVPAKGRATRLELFPELLSNDRREALADQFDFSRVKRYLAQQVWQRTITGQGGVKFRGHYIYISYRMARQQVTITFDPVDHLWLIKSVEGALVKTCNKPIFTEQEIRQHGSCLKE